MSNASHERSRARFALVCLLAAAVLGGCSAGTSDGGEIGGAGAGVGGGGGSGTPDPAPDPTPVLSLSASISWQAASGPVAGYHVLVSRNGGAFLVLTQAAEPTAVVSGVEGDVIRVEVAAFDAAGNTGPISEPSDPLVFVGPTSAGGGDAAPAPSPDPTPQTVVSGGGSDPASTAPADASAPPTSGDPVASNPPASSGDSGTAEPAAGGARGDLDGDGVDDLVWQTEDGALVRITSADLTRVRLYSLPEGGWRVAAVGDFDGDDRSDLLFAAPGELALASGTALRAGPGALALEAWAHLPADAALAAAGDFDGDGAADAAVVDAAGASLWLAGGDVVALPASAADARIAGAGDADGDGSDDLLWVGAGGTSLWRLVGGAVASVASVSTLEGATFVAFADLDDDGAAELALRTASGEITAGDVVAPFASWQEPAPGDAALAGCGDYDGDGARDRLWQDAASLRLVDAGGEQQIALDPASPWRLLPDCR